MAHASDIPALDSDPSYWRAILESNVGFSVPDAWIAYARSHNFRHVNAVRIDACPDCGSAPTKPAWAQYVYYSTLFRIHACKRCHLNWCDVRLAPEEIQRHFESAYKDDTYFRVQRDPIFRHTAGVIGRHLRTGGTVLDIGGARGDLMACLIAERADAKVTVHDLSHAATDYARETFGFSTIAGDLSVLEQHGGQFDVVVLSDVMYYEPDLARFWRVLDRLVAPGGTLVVRVPNKYGLIRAWQFATVDVRGAGHRATQDHLRFFNPEHIAILRRRYLEGRMRALGCETVTAMPSPLLGSGESRTRAAMFQLAHALRLITGGRVIATPAMLLVGRRGTSTHHTVR